MLVALLGLVIGYGVAHGGDFPSWDFENTCQHTDYADMDWEDCYAMEYSAHGSVLRRWKDLPAAVRRKCVERELDGIATYFGLSACIATETAGQ